jgi:UDP-galactopyranose mutase
MIENLFASEGIDEHLAWLYTPMAFPLANAMHPEAIVYDCMDELSAFANAPRELLKREKELLEAADLVFTGGPSLYRAKKDRHPAVHCFPSSVDLAHFASALSGVEEPEEQRGLPRPRLGFYGVIDERLDRDLVDGVAAARPDWQLVLMGPVVKIDPASLPKRPNVHYFGTRRYEDLPAYLSGWDVALLPFAQNGSTEFISPTKTLEYMAAERPIVSTPIRDVAEPYGDIVRLGDTVEEFVAACETALAAPPADRDRRVSRMRQVLAATSWDKTARAMEALIADIVPRRTLAAMAAVAATPPNALRSPPSVRPRRRPDSVGKGGST